MAEQLFQEEEPQLPQGSIHPLDFSVLRLECSPPATIPALHRHPHPHRPCANCGCCGGSSSCAGAGSNNSNSGSLKRPLPSASSLLHHPNHDPQLPKPKKLFLDPVPDAAAADPQETLINPKISVPAPEPNTTTSATNNLFLLRRCISDPYHAPPAPASQSPLGSFPGSGSGIFSNSSRSPENDIKTTPDSSISPCSASKCNALPPRPPPILRRCVSDPTPSPGKSFSRSSSSDELDKTPNAKRLRKMWHCWKEMNSRMEELLIKEQPEKEEASRHEENGGNIIDQQNDNYPTKNDYEIEFEESLSVEKNGECLTVHFNCHCGKGYQFLLAEGNCYYRLM